MANKIKLQPNDRYAIFGKTGSGKTKFSLTLATHVVREVNKKAQTPWQVWWLDTKNDPTDVERLRKWHYTRVKSLNRGKVDEDGSWSYRYFLLQPSANTDDLVSQAQTAIRGALKHKNVLVVVDEYTQVVVSTRMPGKDLKDLFTRGRGLRTGIIGQSQEPTYIPRQLASQATHLFLFDLSLPADREWAKSFCPQYRRPTEMGSKFGFWYCFLDGDAEWFFFQNERDFFEQVLDQTARSVQAVESA